MSLSMKEDVTEDLKKKVEDTLSRKSFNRFDKNVADTNELLKHWAELKTLKEAIQNTEK